MWVIGSVSQSMSAKTPLMIKASMTYMYSNAVVLDVAVNDDA